MDFRRCGENLQAIIGLAISAHCNPEHGIKAMISGVGPIIATALGAQGWGVRINHGNVNTVEKRNFAADRYRLSQPLHLIDCYGNRFLEVGELVVCRDTEPFSGRDKIYLQTVAALLGLIFISPFFEPKKELDTD